MFTLTDVFLFIVICFIFLIVLKKKNPLAPPGPWALPFVGYFFQLSNRPHLKFYELSKTYGEIFSLQIGNRKAVVLNGHDTIMDALCNNSIALAGRPDFLLFKFLAQRGSFSFMGYCPEWRLKRKSTTKTINILTEPRSHSKTYAENVHKVCGKLVEKFRKTINHPYDPKRDLAVTVCYLIDCLCYGEYREDLSKDYDEFLKSSFSKVTSVDHFVNAFPWTQCVFWILGFFSKGLIEKMDNLVISKIRKRLESKQNSDIDCVVDGLSQILGKNPDSENSIPFISDMIKDVIGAGIETTTHFLQFSILYLLAFPEWQIKIQNEIDKVTNKKESLSMDHFDHLTLLKAFLLEVKRYSCFIPFGIYRSTVKDVFIHSYLIPENTLIIPNVYSAHFDDRIWKNPNVFEPTRFLTEDGKIDINIQAKLLIFGAGRRRCIGQHLADKNSVTVVGKLLQNFSLHCAPGFVPDLNNCTNATFLAPKTLNILVKER